MWCSYSHTQCQVRCLYSYIFYKKSGYVNLYANMQELCFDWCGVYFYNRVPTQGADDAAETIDSHLTNSVISASLISIHCTWFIVSIYSTGFHKLELQP